MICFNKFIFAILILGVSSLLAQSGLQPLKKVKVKAPDAIEILVNDLLLEKRASVRYNHNNHIQEPAFKEGKYFVQMFAYSRYKPTKLISKLEKRGYQAVINRIWRNDKKINLVLVGPYKSKVEVQKHLSMLKSIERGAFIYVAK